jgi:hypothetical protein
VRHRRRNRLALLVAMLLCGLVTGCSSGGGSTGSGTGSPVVIKVAVRNGKVVPPTHRVQVSQGSKVRLEVTSDKADVVHVHGVNIEKPLLPGKTRTLVFTENESGLFEVETHVSNLQLLQIEVR